MSTLNRSDQRDPLSGASSEPDSGGASLGVVQDILNSLPAHVALLDDRGVICAVNDTWLRFAHDNGNPPRQSIGVGANYLDACRWAILQGDSNARAAVEGIAAVLQRRTDRFTCEYPCHAPRQQRWFLLQVSRSQTHGGVVMAHTDITASKLAQEALRDSEQFLHHAAAIAGFGVFQHDHIHNRVHCSPELYRIIDIDPAQAIDLATIFKVTHPDDRPRVIEAIQRAHDPAGDGAFRLEHRIVRTDGSVRWVLARSHTEFQGTGSARRPTQTIGAVIDITQRRQHEEDLRRLNEQLESRVQQRTAELEARARQLTRVTSELTRAEERERRRLADVLHDHIQQLLVGARLNLEVAARREEGPMVDSIRQAQHLLAESIRACRSMTVELSPPILHTGLPAALNWLVKSVHGTHGLHVTLDLQAPVDPGRDDLRIVLFQATRELLFNVVKHAGVKEASVTLSSLEPDQLCLVVSDRGRGFVVEQVADPSAQGGFGLFSIRERLALLGGCLELRSAPGQGVCVTMVAPMQAPAASDAASNPDAGPTRTPAPAATKPRAAIRVLLADDHKVLRQGLRLLLGEEPDIQIVGEASDGVEAVDLARTLTPDLVLMDVNMPRMDGMQATRIIRAELPGVTVIGLSMYDQDERAEEMRLAGACAYVAKHGEAHVLLNTIRRCVHLG
jgi:PAS domain S-box-containing protein